jgi:hypothetical protein
MVMPVQKVAMYTKVHTGYNILVPQKLQDPATFGPRSATQLLLYITHDVKYFSSVNIIK